MADLKKVILGLECRLREKGNRGCSDCPYDEDFDCLGCDPMLRDALALLRERIPRVLTVEEVKACLDDFERVYWYEERGRAAKICLPRYYNYASWYDDEPDPADEFVSIGVFFTDCYDNAYMQDYGKTWRLWTLEPTEEEMKGAAWDNGED